VNDGNDKGTGKAPVPRLTVTVMGEELLKYPAAELGGILSIKINTEKYRH